MGNLVRPRPRIRSEEERGAEVSSDQTEYWKGWIAAIRMADIMLQCCGDDRTIRHCRQKVLRLACVSCEPDHIVFLPVWPSDERLIELLSGPTGIPASIALESEAKKKGGKR
jgi:hypothetical protein